jgi:membrane protein implicated in regulation of membrane protease activity
MIFTTFSSDREFSKYLVWKLFTGGLFLLALGVLLLLIPELLAYPLAFLFFLVAFYLFAGAWKVFWTMRGAPSEEREYEEASFRELP